MFDHQVNIKNKKRKKNKGLVRLQIGRKVEEEGVVVPLLLVACWHWQMVRMLEEGSYLRREGTLNFDGGGIGVRAQE